jgi:hypothetical protein
MFKFTAILIATLLVMPCLVLADSNDVSTTGGVEGTEEIDRDGVYVLYSNGIVFDSTTKLEWIVHPQPRISWKDGKRWVENLKIAGGGWRMPTTAELLTLDQLTARPVVTPLLKMAEPPKAWSGEKCGIVKCWAAYIFSFHISANGSPDDKYSTLAVRNRRQ